MIFSCTKKVRDKIQKLKKVESSKSEIGFNNWYVNSFTLRRKKYFLFTNSETLFNIILYTGTIKEIKNLELRFREKLDEVITREIGSSEDYLSFCYEKGESVRYMKTNSSSVLGSMNDFIFQISWHINDDHSLNELEAKLHNRLNDVPMGTLNYDCARDRMKLALEKHRKLK